MKKIILPLLVFTCFSLFTACQLQDMEEKVATIKVANKTDGEYLINAQYLRTDGTLPGKSKSFSVFKKMTAVNYLNWTPGHVEFRDDEGPKIEYNIFCTNNDGSVVYGGSRLVFNLVYEDNIQCFTIMNTRLPEKISVFDYSDIFSSKDKDYIYRVYDYFYEDNEPYYVLKTSARNSSSERITEVEKYISEKYPEMLDKNERTVFVRETYPF